MLKGTSHNRTLDAVPGFQAKQTTSPQPKPARTRIELSSKTTKLNQVFENDDQEITSLYKQLEARIGVIFVSNPEDTKSDEARLEAIKIINEIQENQNAFDHTKRSVGKAGININSREFFSNISSHDLEDLDRVKELISQAKLHQDEMRTILGLKVLKQYLGLAKKALEEPQGLKTNLLRIYSSAQKSLLHKSGKLAQIKRKIEILENILKYHQRNDSLMNLSEEIGQSQDLKVQERMKVLDSLEKLRSSHPDLATVKAKLPDYDQRLRMFLKDTRGLKAIPGLVPLIHSAAQNFLATDTTGKDLPYVLGAFTEARFCQALQNNGFIIESIGTKFVENHPFIIDEHGNDLLEMVNFENPAKALEQLQARKLISVDKSNARMKKLKLGSVNHILYFDSETGDILSHKKNRTSDDNRIFVRQRNGSYALAEIDCICTKLEDSNTYYIEHKITPESFITKNLGTAANLEEFESGNPGQLTQLEKLMVIAKSHNAKPSIMIDFSKIKESDIKEHPLRQSIQDLVGDIEAKRPDLERLTILDENSQDLTELFHLAA